MNDIIFYGLEIKEENQIEKNEIISIEFSVKFKLFDTEKERKVFMNQHLGKRMSMFNITKMIMETFKLKNKEQVYNNLRSEYNKHMKQIKYFNIWS